MGEPCKPPADSPDMDEVLLMNEAANKEFSVGNILKACKVIEDVDQITKKDSFKVCIYAELTEDHSSLATEGVTEAWLKRKMDILATYFGGTDHHIPPVVLIAIKKLLTLALLRKEMFFRPGAQENAAVYLLRWLLESELSVPPGRASDPPIQQISEQAHGNTKRNIRDCLNTLEAEYEAWDQQRKLRSSSYRRGAAGSGPKPRVPQPGGSQSKNRVESKERHITAKGHFCINKCVISTKSTMISKYIVIMKYITGNIGIFV